MIALSGGSDSMMLAHLAKNSGCDVVYAHFNHQYRPESTDEERILSEQFPGLIIGRYDEYSDKPKTEATMREARYRFFSKVRDGRTIRTGHHRDDRIESTILNLKRGTGIHGLYGMSRKNHIMLNNDRIPVERPLLSLSKKDILSYCQKHNIFYFHDITNEDSSVSQRNAIRKLLPLYPETIEWCKKVYENEVPPYALVPYQLPDKEIKYIWELKVPPHDIESTPSPYRNFGSSSFEETLNDIGTLSLPESFSVRDRIVESLSSIGCSFVSRQTREHVFSVMRTGGWMKSKGRGVASSQGCIVVRYGEEFWKNPPSRSIPCAKDQKFDFFGFSTTIKEESCTVRFARQGDKRKGKNLYKRLLNKKVPFFLRPYIPVIESHDTIIYVHLRH